MAFQQNHRNLEMTHQFLITKTMSSRKLINSNKATIFTEMLNGTGTARTDTIYFSRLEFNGLQMELDAFGRGVLISFVAIDDNIGKVTYVDILT